LAAGCEDRLVVRTQRQRPARSPRRRTPYPRRLHPETEHPGESVARWIAGVAALAVAIVVTAHCYRWTGPAYHDSGGSVPYLDHARKALRDDGYGIVVFCLTILVAGALLQAPLALRRRARVGRGLVAVLAFLGYFALVAGLATLIAGTAPQFQSGAGHEDPGAIYGALLVVLLGGPVLLVVGGGIFARSDTDFPLAARIWATMLITGGIGGAALADLGCYLALRSATVRTVLPPAGASFLHIGAIAGGGLLAIALGLALTALFNPEPRPEVVPIALAVAAVAGWFAVTGILGAQLGRILPGSVVPLVAVPWLIGSGPVLGGIFVRRMQLRRRRQDETPPAKTIDR
jgi:hypothetical protein